MIASVSVIIPVYNAANFVRQAVDSALMQPETGEVILIEDASPDDSLDACRDLAEEYPQVALLQHQDGKNHGAGASRNLGIRNARFPYIAFLDADDYFLPGRFSIAKELFEADPSVEGVYEAVGTRFETPEVENQWRAARSGPQLTTMKKRVAPESLFEAQGPIGHEGYFHLDGWTVKSSIFAKAGLFDVNLRLHQDTAMCVKAAAVCRMVPGRLDVPVAIRRMHDRNRITAQRSPGEVDQARILMWGTLWRWGKGNLSRARRGIVLDRLLSCAAASHALHSDSVARRRSRFVIRVLGLVMRYPALLLQRKFWSWPIRRIGLRRNRTALLQD